MIQRIELATIETWLFREHGAILSAATTARLLGFKSVDSLRQARRAKRLPIPMFEIEGRRGWFSSTRDVALWLERTAGYEGLLAVLGRGPESERAEAQPG